ncbi:MAG: ribosome maturation factor RimM [Clostridia bacterium]|nr:ribosome maturation factor RimM [Clostridia bacterium]
MTSDPLILVGEVIGAHGLRGEVKVATCNGSPRRFQGVQRVYLERNPGDEPVPALVDSERAHGRFALVRLLGMRDLDQARTLVGASMYLPASEIPPAPEGEFYEHQLVGLMCVSSAGERLGVVADVLDMPANHVIVVRQDSGAEFLVPVVHDILLQVDVIEGRIVVDDRPGLR